MKMAARRAGLCNLVLNCFILVSLSVNVSLQTEYEENMSNVVKIRRDVGASNVSDTSIKDNKTKVQTISNETITQTTEKTFEYITNVVPTRHNLGENGTGIRKGKEKTISPLLATVSEPISVDDNTNETVPDAFDEPEEKLAIDHNITTIKTDNHSYYNSAFYSDPEYFKSYWKEANSDQHVNTILSNSYRRAAITVKHIEHKGDRQKFTKCCIQVLQEKNGTLKWRKLKKTVKLGFDFPFYGQYMRNITIATGGFMYVGDYVHSWLATTQYIAPLMANFDTTMYNDSYVKIKDNGTALTVIWENVSLQDKRNSGKFTFAATLHKNGDIIFAYKSIPIPIDSIKVENHPVKVGVSDAYIVERLIFFVRRKTIFEYHRVNFLNHNLSNGTILKLTALPTCLEYKTCEECTNHKTAFTCSWCAKVNRCSNGNDRSKQDWTVRNCDKNMILEEAKCPKPTNQIKVSETGQGPTVIYETNHTTNPRHDFVIAGSTTIIPNNAISLNTTSVAAAVASAPPETKGSSFGGFITAFVTVLIVGSLLAWVLYAYKYPSTKSGQLLIRYRPSQWGWRRGEARYTAATIHM